MLLDARFFPKTQRGHTIPRITRQTKNGVVMVCPAEGCDGGKNHFQSQEAGAEAWATERGLEPSQVTILTA